jgi:hypothetical protein
LIFDQLEFIRNKTVELIETVDEKQLTIIPKGFNNNILWNFGHIYVIQERMVFLPARVQAQLDDPLVKLFNNKTTPADWPNELPSLHNLIPLLKEQPGRIKETFQDRPDEKLPEPITLFKSLTFHTVRDLITFTIFHEGMHLETMKVYNRLLKADLA